MYAVDDEASWDEVARLRDTVIRYKGDQVGCRVYSVVILWCGYNMVIMVQVPIVVVGNKTDQARTTAQPELEAVASLDWEHGYVECSARDNTNVDQVTGVTVEIWRL